MKYLLPVFAVLAILLIQYCKSSEYTPDNYPDRQIIFGSGGGVTGLYTHYYVFDNGQIFKNSTMDTTFTKVKNAGRDQVAQLFNTYEILGLQDKEINNPGNMSFYIEFKTSAKTHNMTWGANDAVVDPNVKTIYTILQNLVK